MPYAIHQRFESGQLVESVEIPWTEELIRQEAKGRRNRTIAAGTSFQGHPLPADTDTVTQVMGAVLASQIVPGYTLNWKMGDGEWITLDATGIVLMARALRLHTQGAFDAELAVIAQIEAGELTLEQIGEGLRGG